MGAGIASHCPSRPCLSTRQSECVCPQGATFVPLRVAHSRRPGSFDPAARESLRGARSRIFKAIKKEFKRWIHRLYGSRRGIIGIRICTIASVAFWHLQSTRHFKDAMMTVTTPAIEA